MTDPADPAPRPQLPDPQQDRHVAFPELSPAPTVSAASPPPARSPRPAPTSAALPPEAWAPRGATPALTPSRPIAPPPPAPTAAHAKKRSSWPVWATVVGALVVLGNVSDGSNTDVTGSGEVTVLGQQGADPEGFFDETVSGWFLTVREPQLPPPLPSDTGVTPVPDGTKVLRVEVVSLSPEPVSLQMTTDSGPIEESLGAPPPLVREFHVGTNSHRLDVKATSDSGGEVPIQCRIYAGKTLVALATGPVDLSCSVTW